MKSAILKISLSEGAHSHAVALLKGVLAICLSIGLLGLGLSTIAKAETITTFDPSGSPNLTREHQRGGNVICGAFRAFVPR